jgi:8-oxo-dGTP diphosphatase
VSSAKSVLQVTAAVIRLDNKILAARRGPGRHLAGYWEFPGGKIELNETPEQCLVRELKEELSIEAIIGDHIMNNDYHYPNKTITLHSYWVNAFTGDIQLTDHDSFRWLTVAELDELQWAPADIVIVENIKQFLKN